MVITEMDAKRANQTYDTDVSTVISQEAMDFSDDVLSDMGLYAQPLNYGKTLSIYDDNDKVIAADIVADDFNLAMQKIYDMYDDKEAASAMAKEIRKWVRDNKVTTVSNSRKSKWDVYHGPRSMRVLDKTFRVQIIDGEPCIRVSYTDLTKRQLAVEKFAEKHNIKVIYY